MEEYIAGLEKAMHAFKHGGEEGPEPEKPQANYQNVMKKHIATLKDGLQKENKELKHAETAVKKMFSIIQKDDAIVLSIWKEAHDLLKMLVMSSEAEATQKIIHEFEYLYRNISPAVVEKNPDMVRSWIPMFVEIVENGKSEVIERFVHYGAIELAKKFQPKKEDVEIWMSLLKAMVKHSNEKILCGVKNVLGETKYKKIWTWKTNWKHGQEIIQIISKVENFKATKDVVDLYKDIIEEIVSQFETAKAGLKIAYDVAELAVTIMEQRNDKLNRIAGGIIYHSAPLTASRDKIPGLLKRFEVLLKDPDYPWSERNSDDAGGDFMYKIVDSYTKSSQMDKPALEVFISIFTHCVEGDVEYIELGDGNRTVFLQILQIPLEHFWNLFVEQKASHKLLEPLIPIAVKMVSKEDEEEVQSMGGTCLYHLQDVEILKHHVYGMGEWYKGTRDTSALTTLQRLYDQVDVEFLQCDMEGVFKAMKRDPNNLDSQIMFLNEVGKKTPEVFTKKMMTVIINEHFQQENLKMMSLILFANVCGKNPEAIPFDLLVQKVFVEHSMGDMGAHYLQQCAIAAALASEEYADKIFDEIVRISKTYKEPGYKGLMITAMKTIASEYGPENLKKHRPYFENLKKTTNNAYLLEAVTSVINILENRSLEGVSKSVKQSKKDVTRLDKQNTKTTKEVAVVKKQVVKNTKGVAEAKKGLNEVNKKVDVVEEDLEETKAKVDKIDHKTTANAPSWSRDLSKLMNPEADQDWRSLAGLLGYSNDDIKGWATQHDPCMALLGEWYATHGKTEANLGLLKVLQEMKRDDGAAIVDNAMKNINDIEEEEPEYASPPPIFISYQWGHQKNVILLRDHLRMAGYECWLDVGQMGSGDKLLKKIDKGIRGAKIIICCVSEEYAKSSNCVRELNQTASLGKHMIPLLMEKMSWPPTGSMGPILSEYLFVRFFQRPGEETGDDRYWPKPKFHELLMQINLEVTPKDELVGTEYKEWWKPMAEEIVIDKGRGNAKKPSSDEEDYQSPDVFLSYQWGKQPQVKNLYRRLTELGFSCWMDIYQMGGGDSLYQKIDRGVRGCKIVLTCITSKYALSANCRKEVSLADSIKKPMIPLLLEKMDWPPAGPMSMVFTQLLFINFYRDQNVQMNWEGEKFDELLMKMHENGLGNMLSAEREQKTEPETEPANEPKPQVVAAEITQQGEIAEKVPEVSTQQPPKARQELTYHQDKLPEKQETVDTRSGKNDPQGDYPSQEQLKEQRQQQSQHNTQSQQQGTVSQQTTKPPPTQQETQESPPTAKKSSACILL